MIVTLKTLQEDTFTVEIDPSQTVRKFKEKIEMVKGHEFPAKNMKLMYAGKFLVDSNRVCDYNVEEKKFVIVVVKKPKIVVKQEEPESSSSSSHERTPFTNGRRPSDEEIVAANRDQLISHIAELGFTRNEVDAALRASNNNPDRAVEYLIQGVFSSSDYEDADMDPVRNSDRMPDISDAQLLRHISLTGPPSPRRAALPSQERIFQLFTEAVAECQQQSRLQESVMEEDHDLITQTFSEMEAADLRNSLSEDRASASLSPDSMQETMPGSDRIFGVWNDAFTSPGGIGFGFAGNLQDRDHEAIERLKQLGFSDHKAIEAYFVCERNEHAAAEYLLSQKFE